MSSRVVVSKNPGRMKREKGKIFIFRRQAFSVRETRSSIELKRKKERIHADRHAIFNPTSLFSLIVESTVSHGMNEDKHCHPRVQPDKIQDVVEQIAKCRSQGLFSAGFVISGSIQSHSMVRISSFMS